MSADFEKLIHNQRGHIEAMVERFLPTGNLVLTVSDDAGESWHLIELRDDIAALSAIRDAIDAMLEGGPLG